MLIYLQQRPKILFDIVASALTIDHTQKEDVDDSSHLI